MNRLAGRAAIALLSAVLLAAAPAAARTYDCTKPGNANKAECKGKTAAAPAAAAKPVAPATTTAKTARTYDCSKPGNANKAACKGKATAAAQPAPAAVAPSATRAATPAAAKAPTPAAAAQPGQATAQCKDGTMSHSQHRSGTCAGHGGVANWLAKPAQ
jgi:hypothetical protein